MHARNFTTNVPKILDLKSSSEQIFSRKLSLGAPEIWQGKSEWKQLLRPSTLRSLKKIIKMLSIVNVDNLFTRPNSF